MSRFVGVITSPKETFQAVAAHPKWLGMLAVVTVIVAVCVTLPMTTEAGQRAALEQNVRQMESFGVQVNDQMYAGIAAGMRNAAPRTFISILIIGPIVSVMLAAILYLVFTIMMGGQATFKQLFAVYVHSTAVSALGQLFLGPLNYFRGSVSSATNLGVLWPFEDTSFVARLLGMVDIFVIWWLVVLAIGLAVLYRRRTQPIAIAFFSAYGLFAIAIAAIMAAFGRS